MFHSIFCVPNFITTPLWPFLQSERSWSAQFYLHGGSALLSVAVRINKDQLQRDPVATASSLTDAEAAGYTKLHSKVQLKPKWGFSSLSLPDQEGILQSFPGMCFLAEPQWRNSSWQSHVSLLPRQNTNNKPIHDCQDEDTCLIWLPQAAEVWNFYTGCGFWPHLYTKFTLVLY